MVARVRCCEVGGEGGRQECSTLSFLFYILFKNVHNSFFPVLYFVLRRRRTLENI